VNPNVIPLSNHIPYLTEVASRYGDAWIDNDRRRQNAEANPPLYRQAVKMATGSGPTPSSWTAPSSSRARG
jgi:hypothetical protein